MLSYVNGDATNPRLEGPKVIVHCCNNIGKWGAGFVLALSRKWPVVEKEYKKWYQGQMNDSYCTGKFGLGNVQFVLVEQDTWVANIIGQEGIYIDNDGNPPIRYPSIRKGLQEVKNFASFRDASVHMPKMGAGLAGGNWDTIEGLIKDELADLDVTVYNWP